MNGLNKLKNKFIKLNHLSNLIYNRHSITSLIFAKRFSTILKRDLWEDINSDSEIQNFYEKLNPSETKKYLENSHLLQEKLIQRYSTKLKYIHSQKKNMHKYSRKIKIIFSNHYL